MKGIKVSSLSVSSPDGLLILKDITFSVSYKQSIGITGESGSGKSTLLLSLLGILPMWRDYKVSGEVIIDSYNIYDLAPKEIEKLFWDKIGLVLQNPYAMFDPYRKIGPQIEELIRIRSCNENAYEYTLYLFKKVGLPYPEKVFKSYPFELSGGMLQRCSIAQAIACSPDFVALDEPTTNLDSVNQLRIIKMLNNLKRERGFTYIFVTHNLRILKYFVDFIIVLYNGQILEAGSANEILESPLHPYTKILVESNFKLNSLNELSSFIKENSKSIRNKGCPWLNVCSYATEKCEKEEPIMIKINEKHQVRCWHYE